MAFRCWGNQSDQSTLLLEGATPFPNKEDANLGHMSGDGTGRGGGERKIKRGMFDSMCIGCIEEK